MTTVPSTRMPRDPSPPDWLRWAADLARGVGSTTSIAACVAALVALVVVVVLLVA